MAPVRRVAGQEAGPNAIGILTPPGRRTVVILRPRALPWDLLLAQSPEQNGAALLFREIGHLEAPGLTQNLYRILEKHAATADVAAHQAGGFCVVLLAGAYRLILCPRKPGTAYRPAVFASEQDARVISDQVAAAFRPVTGAALELYFNTRQFTH
jgi:hypothetical protein